MAKVSSLSFANLTCRFGDRFVLIDLAREVIYPAFFTRSHRREYGPTAYFFRDIGMDSFEVEGIERPQLTIYGRLIKDTVVKRVQVYSEEGGLVPDVATMESAPSMFFALDLDNHKLIYLPEVAGAPTAAQFAHTLQDFARRELENFIRRLKEESKRTEEPRTLGELRIDYPEPIVEATPLSGDGNIDTFVGRFDKILRVGFQLNNTNAEFSRAEDFRRIREMKDDVLASTTTLTHHNKEGLRKDAIAGELKAAGAGGNQKITVSGVADDGTPLEISNDDLKFQIPFPNPPEERNARALAMIRSYFDQLRANRLRPDIGTPDVAKLAALRGDLDGSER